MFLRGFPRVALEDVPAENCKCPICHDGYTFGPYLGYIQDRAAQPLALRKIEAHRRAVSLREAVLYNNLRGRGLELAGNLDPGDVLDYFQDQALFEYLQGYGAFRDICHDEDCCEEVEGPMRGEGLDVAILKRGQLMMNTALPENQESME